MKHIRNILLLITIIFAFVMQAEVYQNKLSFSVIFIDGIS